LGARRLAPRHSVGVLAGAVWWRRRPLPMLQPPIRKKKKRLWSSSYSLSSFSLLSSSLRFIVPSDEDFAADLSFLCVPNGGRPLFGSGLDRWRGVGSARPAREPSVGVSGASLCLPRPGDPPRSDAAAAFSSHQVRLLLINDDDDDGGRELDACEGRV
jgi:hypothetical protein